MTGRALDLGRVGPAGGAKDTPSHAVRVLLAVLALAALSGCGETVLAYEPVITAQNAARVPELEDYYEPYRWECEELAEPARSRYCDAENKADEKLAIEISLLPNEDADRGSAPYYRAKVILDDGVVEVDTLLVAPLRVSEYGGIYLFQYVVPETNKSRHGGSGSNADSRDEPRYAVSLARISDWPSRGRVITLLKPRDGGYRILEIRAEHYGVRLVTEQIVLIQPYMLSDRDAMLRTLEHAPDVDLTELVEFKKTGPPSP